MTDELTPSEEALVQSAPERVYGTEEMVLALDDSLREDVWIPEWDVWMQVRGLTGTERDAWEASITNMEGRRTRMNLQNFRAKLVARTVVKPGTNDPVFHNPVLLGQKSASALQRLFEVAQKLSRLTDEDVEELTQDFSGDPNASNGSGSPATLESQ
jgi:hypothetical protein